MFSAQKDLFENEYEGKLTSLLESTEDIIKSQYEKIKKIEFINDEQMIKALDNGDNPRFAKLGNFFENLKADALNSIKLASIETAKLNNFGDQISQAVKLRFEDLTQQQSNIFIAIETNNIAIFYDLGGVDKVNLNFGTELKFKSKILKDHINSPFLIYPIMSCVAKGKV